MSQPTTNATELVCTSMQPAHQWLVEEPADAGPSSSAIRYDMIAPNTDPATPEDAAEARRASREHTRAPPAPPIAAAGSSSAPPADKRGRLTFSDLAPSSPCSICGGQCDEQRRMHHPHVYANVLQSVMEAPYDEHNPNHDMEASQEERATMKRWDRVRQDVQGDDDNMKSDSELTAAAQSGTDVVDTCVRPAPPTLKAGGLTRKQRMAAKKPPINPVSPVAADDADADTDDDNSAAPPPATLRRVPDQGPRIRGQATTRSDQALLRGVADEDVRSAFRDFRRTGQLRLGMRFVVRWSAPDVNKGNQTVNTVEVIEDVGPGRPVRVRVVGGSDAGLEFDFPYNGGDVKYEGIEEYTPITHNTNNTTSAADE